MNKGYKTIKKTIKAVGLDIEDVYMDRGHFRFLVKYKNYGPYKIIFSSTPKDKGYLDNKKKISQSIKDQKQIPNFIKDKLAFFTEDSTNKKEEKMVKPKEKSSKKPANPVKPERVLTPEENIKLGYARLQAYRNSLKKDLTDMQSVVK